jgi:hypothetical protein
MNDNIVSCKGLIVLDSQASAISLTIWFNRHNRIFEKFPIKFRSDSSQPFRFVTEKRYRLRKTSSSIRVINPKTP